MSISYLARYRWRVLWSLLYVLATVIGSAPPALAQGDVINTRSGDPNASGDCVDGPPHPHYGSPDQFAVEDPTWKEMANDGYYALCVGSCSTQFAYCYKNPYFGGDSYETKWDPERDGDPPLVMEDGTPVEIAFGNVPPAGPSIAPEAPPSSDEGDCILSSHEPPVCIAQVLPGEPGPRPPFQLGAEFKFVPGTAGDFTAEDPRAGRAVVRIETGVGGGAPKEPGLDVEWEKWYRDWISRVTFAVHLNLKNRFRNDPSRQWTDVNYRVFPDGTIQWTKPGMYSSNGSYDFYNEVVSDLKPLKAPPFPAGSKKQFVQRYFKFNHNTGDAGEIKLGGTEHE